MALAQTVTRTVPNVDNPLTARLSKEMLISSPAHSCPEFFRLKLAAALREGCNPLSLFSSAIAIIKYLSLRISDMNSIYPIYIFVRKA